MGDKSKTIWLVMSLQDFADLEISVMGQTVIPALDPNGPQHWVAVFDDRAKAVKWCDGDESRLVRASVPDGDA